VFSWRAPAPQSPSKSRKESQRVLTTSRPGAVVNRGRKHLQMRLSRRVSQALRRVLAFAYGAERMVVVVVEALVSRHARDEEVATRMVRDEGGREERREGAGAGKCGWVVFGCSSKSKASSFVAALVRSDQTSQDLGLGARRFFSSASLRYASASLCRPFLSTVQRHGRRRARRARVGQLSCTRGKAAGAAHRTSTSMCADVRDMARRYYIYALWSWGLS